MSLISDNIELFIKEMMRDVEGAYELKRNELAERFGCAPSQINYVLQTRFTPERGYIIESRRGGGGCIKGYRLDLDKHELVTRLLEDNIDESGIDEKRERALLNDLLSMGIIDIKQGRLMLSATSDKTLPIAEPARSLLRASILKSMIAAVLAE